MTKAKISDLIILLPGITGSKLEKEGKIIWGFSAPLMLRTLLSKTDNFVQDMSLPEDSLELDIEDGVSATALLPDFHYLPGIKKVDGYSKIQKHLLKHLDVKPGQNYFTFPYDWRRDNRVSARKLQKFIHEKLKAWRETSGNNSAKVIFIAHSMGGLITQYYIDVLGGWKNTRELITFGTPFHGSANSINALVNGLIIKGRTLEKLSNLIRDYTAIYQLLPTYDKAVSLAGGQPERITSASDLPNLRLAPLNRAVDFFDELHAAKRANIEIGEYRENFKISPIVGYRNKTYLTANIVGNSATMSEIFDGKKIGGDGTVPRFSAEAQGYEGISRPVNSIVKHGSLQNSLPILDHIIGALTYEDIDLGDFLSSGYVTLDEEDCYVTEEKIVIPFTTSRPSLEVIGTLWRGERKIKTIKLETSQEVDNSLLIGSLEEGHYTLKVTGPDCLSAETSFLVSDLVKEILL